MATFIEVADFEEGEHQIAFNNLSQDKLQAIIDALEADLLTDLLGASMYVALLADYDSVSGTFSDEKYTKIFEAFAIDYESTIWKSRGIKTMLKAFVYFEYTRKQHLQNRENGFTSPQGENSTGVSAIGAASYLDYNRGAEDWKSIQCYIHINPENFDYSDYNGRPKDLTSWF